MTRFARLLTFTLAALATCLLALPAAFAGPTVVIIVTGPDDARVFRYTRDSLEKADYKVPEMADVLAYIDREGVDIGDDDGRLEIAAKYEATAVIVVDVTDGRKYTLDITSYNGADGSLLGTGKLREKKKKLKKTTRKGFLKQVKDHLEKSSPPGGSAVASGDDDDDDDDDDDGGGTDTAAGDDDDDDDGDDDDDDDDDDDGGGSVGDTNPLDFNVGFRTLTRMLRYNDDLFGVLLQYDLGLGPAVGTDLVWYPGAHFTDGIGSWFGIVAHFHMAFAIDSESGEVDGAFPTTAYGFFAGVRSRIPIGLTEIGLDLGVAQEVFTIDDIDDTTAKPEIPSVEYLSFRPALWTRIGITDSMAILANFGYRVVLDAGELLSDEYFPNASVGGLDMNVGFTWAFIEILEVRASVEWQHYFVTVNPEPGDRWIAGGARDEFISATIGMALRL